MWWLWRHREDHPHQIAQRAKAITQGRGSHVWFRDNHTALYTIADFLRRPSHYTYNVTHTWRQNMRVSINFVAGRGPFVRRVYHELAKIEKLPMPDEAHFSFVVPQRIRAPSRAVMSCAVIHLHYHWQEAAVLESPLVREIELLLRTELATESGAAVRPSAPSAASIAALARGTERTYRAASPQASTAGVGRAGPHLPGDEGKGTRDDGIWTTEVTAAALAARQCRVYVHQVPKATGLRMHPMYSPCAWEHAQHATEVWINRALLGSPWVVSSPADADVVYLDGHHFSEWCAPKGDSPTAHHLYVPGPVPQPFAVTPEHLPQARLRRFCCTPRPRSPPPRGALQPPPTSSARYTAASGQTATRLGGSTCPRVQCSLLFLTASL